MIHSNWLLAIARGWPFWSVLIGLLILAIHRFTRDKAEIERPTEWDREV